MRTATRYPASFPLSFFGDPGMIATVTTLPQSGAGPGSEELTEPSPMRPSAPVVIASWDPLEPSIGEKRFWDASGHLRVEFSYVAKVEASPYQVGLPGDAVASESFWPPLWTQPGSVQRRIRGVVFVAHDHPRLFEGPVELRTACLPWWNPQITLGRHPFERRDE